MKPLSTCKGSLYAGAFVLGMISMFVGNWLESLAEARILSSPSFAFGLVQKCAWIPPCVVLLGLFVLGFIQAVFYTNSSTGARVRLKALGASCGVFAFGMIIAGIFLPLR